MNKSKFDSEIRNVIRNVIPKQFTAFIEVITNENCVCIEILQHIDEFNAESVFHKDYDMSLKNSQILTAILTDLQPLLEIWNSPLYKAMKEDN